MTKKRTYLSLFLGVVLLTSTLFTLVSAQDSAANGIKVSSGTQIRYSISATATYRMYANDIRITVTNPNLYPVIGTLEIVEEKDDVWTATSTTTDLELVPYVINVSKFEFGVVNGPYYGVNSSNSSLVGAWTEDNLEFGLSVVYADVERNATRLNFLYDYTQPNRINEEELDQITSNITYIWDSEFGVLVSYKYDIMNYNDSSMDGFIEGTLEETTLWKLETGGIPGYPMEITLAITFLGISIAIIASKKKHQKVEGKF